MLKRTGIGVFGAVLSIFLISGQLPAQSTNGTQAATDATNTSGATGPTGNSSPSASSSPASATGTGSPASTKRVWTNEDVTGLHDQSSISTVGKSAKPASMQTAAKAKPAKNASWYHDQIAKLQAQLPAINEQIETLQAALSGKTVDETRKYAGVRLDDWQSELAVLQKKRADINEQMETLRDQARHDGVPSNALP